MDHPPPPTEAPPPPQKEAEQPHQDSEIAAQNPNTQENDTRSPSHDNDQLPEPHALGNFKALVMKLALASIKTKPLGPTQTLLLGQRLNQFFPHLHTPDHPPYAAMIRTAVEQLNEEEGSSEEAISEFIKQNYVNLPWAHDALLKHHMRELCKNGDIVEGCNGCYFLADGEIKINPISSPSPASTDCTSPSLGFSYDFISCASSSSSFSESCLKIKPLQRKQRKEGERKKVRSRKRTLRQQETLLQCDKASVRRRGRPRKKDVMEDEILVEAEETEAAEKQDPMLKTGVFEEEKNQLKEQNKFREATQMEFEECGSNEQGGENNTEFGNVPHEQEDQANKKQGTCRKLLFVETETNSEEMPVIRDDDTVTDGQTRAVEEENQRLQEQNEVREELKKIPQEQFEFSQQDQAEGTITVTGIVPSYDEEMPVVQEDDTMSYGQTEAAEEENQPLQEHNDDCEEPKKVPHEQFEISEEDQAEGNIGQVKEALAEQQNQNVISEYGNQDDMTKEQGYGRDQPLQETAIEKCHQEGQESEGAHQQDVLGEGQNEAISEQKFQRRYHEELKRGRGRPPKSEKKIQKPPQVPGRRRGRPRKNDVLKEEIKMTPEKIEEIKFHDLNVEENIGVTEEKNTQKKEQDWMNLKENQVQGRQSEVTEYNLAGEINVNIDTKNHGQDNMVCEEFSDEIEHRVKVTAVCNHYEVNDCQIEPGEHQVEVNHKLVHCQEQDDVIGDLSLPKGYEMIDVIRTEEQNELHEQPEEAGKKNPQGEQANLLIEVTLRTWGSDAEYNKSEVENNKSSGHCDQSVENQNEMDGEQNSQENMQCHYQNQNLEEERKTVTTKEVVVAEMEFLEALIQERQQLEAQNELMRFEQMQADNDFWFNVDHYTADIPTVSSCLSASLIEVREKLLGNNNKQEESSSKTEENFDTCNKQAQQLLGISSAENSSDLETVNEFHAVQLLQKMIVGDDPESRKSESQTPNCGPAGGSNTEASLSRHHQVEGQPQLDADGKSNPHALEVEPTTSEQWSLPDYQHQDGQQQLLQQKQEKPSGMILAATMEEVLHLEHQMGHEQLKKVQSKSHGQERPLKPRRSLRHIQRKTQSSA